MGGTLIDGAHAGELVELGSDGMRRLEIESARAAVSPPPPRMVLKAGGQGLDAEATAAEADPAVLPLHNALPRMAVMTHQVRLRAVCGCPALDEGTWLTSRVCCLSLISTAWEGRARS